MKHTHFYLELAHCNSTKNKLQHETYDFFKSLDGLLIEKENLQGLKEYIVSEIYKLNLKYPRMKPIEVKFSNFGYKDKIFVNTIDAINFHIHTAKIIIPKELPEFTKKEK